MANEQQICYISFHTACLGNLEDPFPLPQAGGGSETVDTSEEEQNSWSASDQEVPHLGPFLHGMFDDFLHLLMVFYMVIYIII